MMSKYFSRLIFLSLCLTASILIPQDSAARPLQIIHTNDLHSFLERGDSPETGGYAAVKAVIDSVRLKAEEQGIETLVLDAGDFSEGTHFFMADEGRQSWRMIDSMGYDAVTLGNHDWMIGTQEMNEILGALQPHTPFLSANLKVDGDYDKMSRYIHPTFETRRAGVRVGVLGLSTDEFIYRWRIQDGEVSSPLDRANDLLPELRARNDLVIALTHLGIDSDVELVQKTSGLDLVIGGHSHTTLASPIAPKDRRGAAVPIVQAGQHGEFVGDLLVDVEAGKPMQILRYRLLPVNSKGEQNRTIAGMVSQARSQLEDRYGPHWLYEVIGQSDVPLERPLQGPTTWGSLCAEAMKESANADLTLDIGEFFGNTQPAGPVTRESLMQFYPRIFDVKKPLGWNVWTIQVPGWLLSIVLNVATEGGLFFNTAGLTYDVVDDDGDLSVKNIRVNGRRLNYLREYTVAVSEGIGRGTLEVSFLLRAIFMPEDTGVPLWSAFEGKLRQSGGVVRATDKLVP